MELTHATLVVDTAAGKQALLAVTPTSCMASSPSPCAMPIQARCQGEVCPCICIGEAPRECCAAGAAIQLDAGCVAGSLVRRGRAVTSALGAAAPACLTGRIVHLGVLHARRLNTLRQCLRTSTPRICIKLMSLCAPSTTTGAPGADQAPLLLVFQTRKVCP